MAEFKIHVNETGEEEHNLLVIILDVKYKTEASFALPREMKSAGQLRMIKSALAKVKFLNDTTIAEREAKREKKLIRTLKKLEKGKDIVFMTKAKKPVKKATKKKSV